VNQYVVNQTHVHPGIAGGDDGSPDRVTLAPGTDHETVVAPTVAGFLLRTGERLVYDFGGGGGWGDPLQRDPQAVLDDVWDEYVSVEAAERDYGVVITGSLDDMTLAVDEPATERLRMARAAR
jgi:N-methylhydantoinase B